MPLGGLTVRSISAVLKRGDVIPGMIAGIQTSVIDQLPSHVHAIATDGAFTSDGTFLYLPKVDRFLWMFGRTGPPCCR